MKSIIWITQEVWRLFIFTELAHHILNNTIFGKIVKPITTFIVNIERRIEREYDLQRGLVKINNNIVGLGRY